MLVNKTLYNNNLRLSHKLFQTLVVNINSLACLKARNEAEKLLSNTIKYCETKTKSTYIISHNKAETVRQTNVKNELTILYSIIVVNFSNKLR